MPRSYGLDLFRAVAIGSVLIAHGWAIASLGLGTKPPAAVDWLGVVGVELFFALSGFLIGRLLLDIVELGPRPSDWFVFMTRRWVRTLPLYVLCVGALLLLLPPASNTSEHALQYLTMTQSFQHPLSDGWFDVTWSLAVEEWFYLLFSATFLAGSAVFGRAGRVTVVVLFLLLPLCFRLVLPTEVDWDAGIRKVTIFRLDSIAYGVVLAMALRAVPRLRHFALPLLAAGLLLVAGSFWVKLDGVSRSFVFNMMDAGATLCLPAAIGLSDRHALTVVVRVSMISYALYLLHIPVFEFLQIHSRWLAYHTGGLALTAIGASTLLAWASWTWFEQPLLRHRLPQRRAIEADVQTRVGAS